MRGPNAPQFIAPFKFACPVRANRRVSGPVSAKKTPGKTIADDGSLRIGLGFGLKDRGRF